MPYIKILIILTIGLTTSLQAAQKDYTYSACLEVLDKGFLEISHEYSLYLTGRENGVAAGVQLINKDFGLKIDLVSEDVWPQTVERACKVVIIDESSRRAMRVFDEAVYKIITRKK